MAVAAAGGMALPLSACDSDGAPPEEKTDLTKQQLITDPHVETGVLSKAPQKPPVVYEGPIQYTTANGDPAWELSQWWSQESIYGAEPKELPSGAYKWENAYKYIVMGPENTPQADFVFHVDAVEEWDGTYRQSKKQNFPHLLISQRISDPDGHVEDSPRVSEMTEVNFNIDARLNQAENIHDESRGYDPNLHVAHFLIYFTIQNLERDHPGFGDLLYFGLTLYDDREPLPDLSTTPGDRGGGNYIYNVGLAPFADQGMQVGEWKNISGDLLPHIKEGMESAWDNGFLQASQDLSHYKFGGMNMGWEVPGLSVVTMQTENLSLEAVRPE